MHVVNVNLCSKGQYKNEREKFSKIVDCTVCILKQYSKFKLDANNPWTITAFMNLYELSSDC